MTETNAKAAAGEPNWLAAIKLELDETFGRVGAHWFIFFLLIVFPFLAIWGAVGVSFGLPLHFRDDLYMVRVAEGLMEPGTFEAKGKYKRLDAPRTAT